MKITVMASLIAIRDMNVNSSQYFTFDVNIVVFEKLSSNPNPYPAGKYCLCTKQGVCNRV
jgi:hypothetical protein